MAHNTTGIREKRTEPECWNFHGNSVYYDNAALKVQTLFVRSAKFADSTPWPIWRNA